MWNAQSTFYGLPVVLPREDWNWSTTQRMRIVFVNSSCQRDGGIETYLQTVMPALQSAGHEVSLCHQQDSHPFRKRIDLPPGSPSWCVAQLGIDRTMAAVRQWRPDVIYSHNVGSVELEHELLKIAPAVFFAHAYYGTCISGTKAFKLPVARPCHRRFGWQCLVHFYPRRCGGMNPVTMLTLYRDQVRRLDSLQKYQAVITHSEYLRSEYVRHGVPPERVFSVPYCVAPLRSPEEQDSPKAAGRIAAASEVWRLVFAGRMDEGKGGMLLLEAVKLVRSATGRSVELVFAGDGPQRRTWETTAAQLTRSMQGIRIDFPGWLGDKELGELFHASDLLIVPSAWPEPFGIVGVQAALEGVPAAAFAVGGIPAWLTDGVNGHLALGDPPAADGLARAIIQCLSDGAHYLSLCRSAAEMARRFTVQGHILELVRQLESASRAVRAG
jgi:glycosyltransferase involved in cell wall biosynthesis